VRGRKKQDLKSEGAEWAERMGYHWAVNTDSAVPFDGFLYNECIIIAVKLKKVRYGLGENPMIEEKFPEEVALLRSLPVPQSIIRELWVRTQNERMYRRFAILPGMTAEIEENTKENYRNPHYREAYWKNAPYHVEIPIPRRDPGKSVSPKTP